MKPFKLDLKRLKILACLTLLLFLPELLQAQVVPTLNTIAQWVVEAVRIIFIIGITIGIARTVILFIQGSPNAVRALVFTIIAALVYFGFSAIIGDVQNLGDIGNITN